MPQRSLLLIKREFVCNFYNFFGKKGTKKSGENTNAIYDAII